MNTCDTALKDLLATVQSEPVFSKIASQFLDVAETTDLNSRCRPKSNDILEKAIASALRNRLGIQSPPAGMRILHSPRFDFFHGSGMVENRFFTVFFFRRERIGLLTCTILGGSTDYIRMSIPGATPQVPEMN
ncbi:MAG: hypothetical protein ACKOEZ_05745 [Spartobacteria bacterium]